MVSIIIPIFNTPKNLLYLFLESLLDLKNNYFEFVLIDDGSEVYIYDICQSFCVKDKRFKYYYQENKGVSIARNYGIDKSNGEWILFADPDDLIKNSLDYIFDKIMRTNEDLIFLGYDIIKDNDEIVRSFSTSKLISYANYERCGNSYLINSLLEVSLDYSQSQGFYLGTPWAKLLRKKFVLDNCISFDDHLEKRQDALFMIDIFLANPVIGCTDQIVYSYRVDNESSITKNYNNRIHEIYLYLLQQINKRNKSGILNKRSITLYTYDLMKEIINLDYCNIKNVGSYQERRTRFLNFRNNELVIKNLFPLDMKNMKLWKKILYWFIYRKNFFVLNNIYIYRKIRSII